MTNEQLRMLLMNLMSRFDDAIKDADKGLVGYNIPRNDIAYDDTIFHPRQPRRVNQPDSSPVALNGIKGLVTEIKMQIDMLVIFGKLGGKTE